MTKCDFCKALLPNGKCYWTLQGSREADCEIAIKNMVKAFQGRESNKDNKKKRWL